LELKILTKNKNSCKKQGVRLELCTSDRVGLLSEVTRIFRENGLSVSQAGVNTQGDKAVSTFCVTDASGGPVDMKTIEAVRNEIGKQILKIKDVPKLNRTYAGNGHDHEHDRPMFSSIGNLIKSQWERIISSNLSAVK
jgi:hypothetical protein